MRNALAAAVIGLGVVLLGACGSDSGGGISGPSAEQIIADCAKTASRSALTKYAQERRGDAEMRLAVAKAADAAKQAAADPGAQPGAPGVLGPPKPPSPEVIKAETEVARWRDLIELLKNPASAEQVFRIKENKVGAVGDNGASSQLGLEIGAGHRDILGQELVFDLEWVKVPRQMGRKAVNRWELRDSRLVKVVEEPGKKAEKG